MDPLGRGALTLAIDGENLEMVELLIIMQVDTKDGLLQAINAEFVEAVELLLEHEELIHKEGELYVRNSYELGVMNIYLCIFFLNHPELAKSRHQHGYVHSGYHPPDACCSQKQLRNLEDSSGSWSNSSHASRCEVRIASAQKHLEPKAETFFHPTGAVATNVSEDRPRIHYGTRWLALTSIVRWQVPR